MATVPQVAVEGEGMCDPPLFCDHERRPVSSTKRSDPEGDDRRGGRAPEARRPELLSGSLAMPRGGGAHAHVGKQGSKGQNRAVNIGPKALHRGMEAVERRWSSGAGVLHALHRALSVLQTPMEQKIEEIIRKSHTCSDCTTSPLLREAGGRTGRREGQSLHRCRRSRTVGCWRRSGSRSGVGPRGTRPTGPQAT